MIGQAFSWLNHLWKGIVHRRRLEDDLEEELRTSFDMLVEEQVARGVPLTEARRSVRLDFEGLTQTKEKMRARWAGAGVHGLLQDLRYAWRGMCRFRSFTLIAVLMLTLGIGITTAMFSIFYGALLRPLPYAKPRQLAIVWAAFRSAGTARAPVSGAILDEVRRRNRAFSGVAGIWTITRTLAGENPEQVKAARVTANFFDVLGVSAARGQTFDKDERGGPAMVLSDGLFRRRFPGDTRLIGKGLPVEGAASTLIGILPANFELHFAPDANVPRDVQIFDTFPNWVYGEREEYFIRLVARVKPGVSMGEAQRDLDRVAAEIRGAYTEYAREDLRFTLTGMQADAVRDVKPALAALFAGAALVLTICCVNVAGLLVARGNDRRKEMAVRQALGAARGRIVRQLLVEGGLLSVLGGSAGLAVGWAGFRGLAAIQPERLVQTGDGGFRWPVVACAAACSLSAALLFALAPAISTFREDLITTLRAGGRSWRRRLHWRSGNALVVGEVTLAFLLVTSAGLTWRTLTRLEKVRPGFAPRNLLAFQVASEMRPSAVAEWETQLSALPGVDEVGATSHLPFDTDIPNWYSPYVPESSERTMKATLISDLRCVTPGYFAAMGARLLEGRYFNRRDRGDGEQVVIVDELLARSTWPGQTAIGKKVQAEHVTEQGFRPVSSVVVGVVEHVHNHSLTEKVRGQIYMPFAQSPRSPLTYVVRARVPPLSLAPSIRRLLHARDRNAAIAKVRPMTEYVEREIAPTSFTAVLAAIFAGLALLLAMTGIYGVLNHQVSQRMQEMGIRMALGASGQELIRLILREGLALAMAGVLIGAMGAVLVSGSLHAFLYGVSPFDPASYALALVLLPLAAVVGCWLPASRAAKADPAEMIRTE